MSVSGTYLERLYNAVIEWYPEYRQRLITAMEEDGPPYGHVAVPQTTQVQNFLQQDAGSLSQLILSLNERYRGLPDATNRVNADLTTYIRRMIILHAQDQAPSTAPNYTPIRTNIPTPAPVSYGGGSNG